MELFKLLLKVLIALAILTIAAVLAGCSSGTLVVAGGDSSVEDHREALELALEQIAYLQENGDTVLANQLKEALVKQSVNLLSREKINRFEFITSKTDLAQAANLLEIVQASQTNPAYAGTTLKGMIVNNLPGEVVVHIQGPDNWTLERAIKGKDRAEIELPSYGNYSVVFIQGLRKSPVLEKKVGPKKNYFDENGQRYDLMATVWN